MGISIRIFGVIGAIPLIIILIGVVACIAVVSMCMEDERAYC